MIAPVPVHCFSITSIYLKKIRVVRVIKVQHKTDKVNPIFHFTCYNMDSNI